jgi:tetratricopeptide (TPR) repeat protein
MRLSDVLASVVLAGVAAGGCAAKHTAAWEVRPLKAEAQAVTASPVDHGRDGDAHWSKRDQRGELEAAIASWEKAGAQNPDDGETWAKLAHAAYLLADGYLSFETEAPEGFDRYLAMHERGMTFGERGLMAISPEFRKRMEGGAKMEEALDVLDKRAVPALYWYSANLGKWANANGTATILKHKNRGKLFIERCMQLDDEYFYAAPHRYLAVLYARAPKIAGGDLDKAKYYFERAIKAAPHYLATRVLWAEFYAPKVKDRTGFERELKYVLEQPDDVVPDLVAENRLEKKKALELLATIDQRF